MEPSKNSKMNKIKNQSSILDQSIRSNNKQITQITQRKLESALNINGNSSQGASQNQYFSISYSLIDKQPKRTNFSQLIYPVNPKLASQMYQHLSNGLEAHLNRYLPQYFPEQQRPFQYICKIQHQKQREATWGKFRFRQSFRNSPMPQSRKYNLYQFPKSIDQIVQQNNYYFDFITRKSRGVSKEAFNRAIRLMQITHNIDINGNLIFDHFDYYACPQQKYLAYTQILKQEKQYYNKNYQIDKYIDNQIKFCVVVVSFNNAKNLLFLRNLDSIFQQQYKNYHLVYIDDNSPDGTGKYVEEYMKENNIPNDKYTLILNKERKGGQQNIYNAAYNNCQLGEIIVTIDGDDSLIGTQVFSLLNALYQQHKPALTYGQCLFLDDKWVEYCSSQQVPLDQLDEKGTYRRRLGFFPTGHLKTFYTDLYRKIKLQDLKYNNGSFYTFATDQTFMVPAIQMVQQRSLFIKQLIYQYRISTGSNSGYWDPTDVLGHVRLQKQPYKKLADISFADNPKMQTYK